MFAFAARPTTIIGAIRWDPWYEPDSGHERAAMEITLGPSPYHDRAPACATVDSSAISFGRCGTQAEMDAEIAEAAKAHIDYWAFCWYGPTSAQSEMSIGWQLYQASRSKDQVKWCLVFANYPLFEREAGGMTAALVGYLTQPNYQHVKVDGHWRPLVYLLHNRFDERQLAVSLAAFRAACQTAGVANPYVVILLMGAPPTAVVATGADAIGQYAFPGLPSPGATYAELVAHVEREWGVLAATGIAMVPTAMTGWDRRPRIEHPVPWELFQKPFAGIDAYFAAGSPDAIAAHVKDMVAWLEAHQAAAPAQTGLIYSWNEYDEGGSTLSPTLDGQDAILNAVGRAL
jgi:hypothetical protein